MVTRGFFLAHRPDGLERVAHAAGTGIVPVQQHLAKATLHTAWMPGA